jgi:hypothetical protein
MVSGPGTLGRIKSRKGLTAVDVPAHVNYPGEAFSVATRLRGARHARVRMAFIQGAGPSLRLVVVEAFYREGPELVPSHVILEQHEVMIGHGVL